MQLNTLFIGQNHVHLDETGSTSEVARELVSMHPAEGTLVTARRQTAGKGQHGNTWFSEPGASLTFSLILYPSFLDAGKGFYLQEAITLAVCDAVSSFLPGLDVMIKWPNDIVVQGRKIAGILVETSVERNRIAWAIAGIGINVGNSKFPGMDGRTPTSVFLEGNNVESDLVLARVLRGIESMYLRLRTGKYLWFKDAFEANMYMMGKESLFILPDGEEISARIAGIGEDGRLLLDRQHQVTAYLPGSIRWKV